MVLAGIAILAAMHIGSSAESEVAVIGPDVVTNVGELDETETETENGVGTTVGDDLAATSIDQRDERSDAVPTSRTDGDSGRFSTDGESGADEDDESAGEVVTAVGGEAEVSDESSSDDETDSSEPANTSTSVPADQIEDGGEMSDGTVGFLLPRRETDVASCREPFGAPGEELTFVAEGFAAGTTVRIAGAWLSLDEEELHDLAVIAATADADGVAEFEWTVPTVPSAATDPVPRGYVFTATGDNPSGGTHTGRMIQPVIAYPDVVPCAAPDAVTTPLGVRILINVLANDTAPTGGSLDASTVRVQATRGGEADDGNLTGVDVNSVTGVVSYKPAAGFWGTAMTSYDVLDEWGVGTEADLTITVEAGCTITGVVDVPLIEGTDGDDVLCVPDRDDPFAFYEMHGKGGDDVILGGAGVEWIYGGPGDDTIYANGGDDEIVTGSGADTVYGGLGLDRVHSLDLADTIIDDSHEFVLHSTDAVSQAGPEAADDWAWAGVSETVEIDVLANDHDRNEDFRPSTLRIKVAAANGTAAAAKTAAGHHVVLYVAPDSGGIDSFAYEVCDSLGSCADARVAVMVGTSQCTITGTSGADTLRGTSGDDVICGLGGDDVIYASGGDDVVVGGSGNDTIYGGHPAGTAGGDGDDTLWGGPGDDTIYGGSGADTVWGGVGDDSLYGNGGDDEIIGGAGADIAAGGGGADTVWGSAGGDTLNGNAGNDTLWGGPGGDTLSGGNGDDALWGNDGDDTLTGGTGADTLHGGYGDDTLRGNTQSDRLWGGPGADRLDGHGHDDELHGGFGADVLRGGAGDDRLWGGPGDDRLDGGHGVDHLDGGDDADSCTRAATSAGCEP